MCIRDRARARARPRKTATRRPTTDHPEPRTKQKNNRNTKNHLKPPKIDREGRKNKKKANFCGIAGA
eukprot:11374024-Karenia_brevis.AAC.1